MDHVRHQTTGIGPLAPHERRQLLSSQYSRTISAQVARRARVVLLRAGGASIVDIARKTGMTRRAIYRWIRAYADGGLARVFHCHR